MPQDTLSSHNATVVNQHTQQAEGYAALTRAASPPPSSDLAIQLGAGPGDAVLDLACGPGSLSLQLAPYVREVTGLDLTPGMLEQARAAQATQGALNVRWIEGDAAHVPFPDASFDLVVSRAAFHHFETPAAVFAEMARVCRPGGHIAVSDVTPDDHRVDAYNRTEKMRDPSHAHAHSVAELRALGDALGLGEPRIDTRMSGPMPYAAVLATSFPEEFTREQLLEVMRADAGSDELGFRAELRDDEVLVTYRTSTLVWDRP
jgi:ubiquinone/menaquinone biosynthesis C-methylase UbiE